MAERGASEAEVIATIQDGERFTAKFDRVGYRRNFSKDFLWRGKNYHNKQVEVYTVKEKGTLLILTVIVKYY
jgi:hypothetical protein